MFIILLESQHMKSCTGRVAKLTLLSGPFSAHSPVLSPAPLPPLSSPWFPIGLSAMGTCDLGGGIKSWSMHLIGTGWSVVIVYAFMVTGLLLHRVAWISLDSCALGFKNARVLAIRKLFSCLSSIWLLVLKAWDSDFYHCRHPSRGDSHAPSANKGDRR